MVPWPFKPKLGTCVTEMFGTLDPNHLGPRALKQGTRTTRELQIYIFSGKVDKTSKRSRFAFDLGPLDLSLNSCRKSVGQPWPIVLSFVQFSVRSFPVSNYTKIFQNKNAGDGVRTHDLQISEVKQKSDRKGGGLLCT